LINTGKYAFSTLTVITSGIRKAYPDSVPILCIYCIIASVSTIYSWVWDVTMDWDLGHAKHNFLRAKLMYTTPRVYYLACIVDLILRAVWAVTLGTTSHTAAFSNPMNTIAAVCEIIRRFIWNIFRLENEHLKNCLQTTATSIPALIASYKQLSSHQIKKHTNSINNNDNLSTDINVNENEIFFSSGRNNDHMHDYEMEEEREEKQREDKEEEVELVSTGMLNV